MTAQRLQPKQIRAARALLDWTQSDLAEAAGVRLTTVRNFESGKHRPQKRTRDNIRAVLEARGIEFTNGDAPGVRLHGR